MKLKRLVAASYGHFSVDMLNASLAMVLTSFSGVLELSVSQIGFGAMIYTFAAALTQPLFGILADRWHGRYLGALGLLWTMTFFALSPFMPSYPALVACLTIGALGSGALHPAGLLNASTAGGRRPTTATSVFFVSGQTGLALGPVLAGIIIQTIGLKAGLPLMSLAALPAVILMATALRDPIEDSHARAKPPIADKGTSSSARKRGIMVGAAFVLLIALRSTTLQSFMMLLPRYFADLNYEPATYGAMLGLFTLAGAFGTFAGGFLGDSYNRRMVVFLSMMISAPFSYGLLHSQGALLIASAALAGMLLNIPHSILLVMAQQLLPARKGMMGGAVLGFMFASGAATAWLASLLADQIGLGPVLTALGFVPIAAGVCAFVLPSTRQPALEPEPVKTPATPAAAD